MKPGICFDKAKQLLTDSNVGPNTVAMFWMLAAVLRGDPNNDFHPDIEQAKEEAIEKIICLKNGNFFEKLPSDVLDDIVSRIKVKVLAGNSAIYQKSNPYLQRLIDIACDNPVQDPKPNPDFSFPYGAEDSGPD